MEKYRKKPVIVEAMQYKIYKPDENNIAPRGDLKSAYEIVQFTNNNAMVHHYHKDDGWCGRLSIETLEEGILNVSVNDWIIKGVNGEFYPCKPEIFEKTYEKVED